MSQIKNFVTAAGAVLGLTAGAMAQNSSLDLDRAYSAELNADAEARTSQLQGGTAGHDGFFYIGDGTGNYRLNMSGIIQFRYSVNLRDTQATNGNGGTDDDNTIGFSIPRMQLRWHGNIVNENWTFRVQADFGQNGDLMLQYGYGQYNFENMEGGFIRWGQFKLPILSEELVAPEFQLAVERSVTNEFFSQQYSQGIMFGYQDDSFAVHLAISDGVGSALTAFNSAVEADFAFTGRVDVKLEGDWDRFDDFTSWRGDDLAARIGGAFHWQTRGDTNPSLATNTDFYLYTIDAAVEGNGWNLYAAFIGSNLDTGSGSDLDHFGAIVQGGVFLSDQWELFGRWDALFLDDGPLAATADSDLHFLTFGVNYYFVPMSHAAKLTIDTVWSLNTTMTAFGSTGTTGSFGSDARLTQVLGDGDDGEFVLRGQISLAF
jgi:hypothetical protein